MHSIERNLGSARSAEPPGAVGSVLVAINDAGVAVGNWRDQRDFRHAYIYDQNNNIIDLAARLRALQSWAADIITPE